MFIHIGIVTCLYWCQIHKASPLLANRRIQSYRLLHLTPISRPLTNKFDHFKVYIKHLMPVEALGR